MGDIYEWRNRQKGPPQGGRNRLLKFAWIDHDCLAAEWAAGRCTTHRRNNSQSARTAGQSSYRFAISNPLGPPDDNGLSSKPIIFVFLSDRSCPLVTRKKCISVVQFSLNRVELILLFNLLVGGYSRNQIDAKYQANDNCQVWVANGISFSRGSSFHKNLRQCFSHRFNWIIYAFKFYDPLSGKVNMSSSIKSN